MKPVEYIGYMYSTGGDDLEDYYDAVEISARVKRGEEKTYTAAEVRRELGVDD